MRPLSLSLAKPTLPVMGRSILGRVLRHLAQAGVSRFAVNAYHASASVRAAVDRDLPKGCSAELFIETELMGTGGALAAPAQLLSAGSEFFLLHNGDTILECPVERLLEATRAPDCLGALLVRPGASSGYRPIGCRDGRLTGLSAGPGDEPATYLGAAALHRSVLENLSRKSASSLFPDLLLPRLDQGWHLATVPYDGPWFEFTSAESYLSRMMILLSAEGGLYLDPEADLDPSVQVSGNLALESGARIHPRAEVSDAVLMAGSVVCEGARLSRAVLAPGAVVGPGEQVRDGVITKDADGAMIYWPFHPKDS